MSSDPQSAPQCSDLESEAAAWVARRANGQFGADEQRAFLAWLNTSAAHGEAYTRAQSLWDRMRGLDAVAQRQLADARDFITRKRRRPLLRRLVVAASVCLAAGLFWHFDPLSHLEAQTYRTAQGEIRSFDLADGSRLELDSQSEARVHYSRRGREINLARGRAAFTVAYGDRRPFDVVAGPARVRDIGTRFDVRRAADRVIVAVLDGEIEVTAGLPGPPLAVRRGQQVTVGSGGEISPLRAVDVESYSAWRERKLTFTARPLREVFEELGRYQPVQLAVSAPKVLDIEVSGVFPVDNLPQTLQTIAATLPVRISRIGEAAWQIDAR